MFQVVGDNMTQETASEALVSTLKGYQMDADEALSIVDKFNEVLAARLCRNANKDRMRVEFINILSSNCWDTLKPTCQFGDESRKKVVGCYMVR